MRALIAQLAVATSDPMTDATATAAMTTVVTIGTVAVISQKGPKNLVNSVVADQTTLSSPLTNLAQSATMMSSTRRSSKAYALSTKTASIR